MSHCPSNGAPSSLSCTEVIERLYEFLDGELTTEVEIRIREHLAACQRCFPHFQHERVFLRFLEKRAQIVKAPPALRRRILDALLNEEATRDRP